MARDLYEVLGVPKNADADTIKKAYRKLASVLHPDKNPGDAKAEARFKEINRAEDVLGDPAKRALYDEFGEDGLREGFDPARARAFRNQAGGFGGVRMEDIFGSAGAGIHDMFGDMMGGGNRRTRKRKGPDVEADVTIDFGAALTGTTISVQVQSGSEPIQVRIPQGAEEGSRLRVRGQGSPGINGGDRGDLLLTIHVREHPFFRREDDDLHLELPLTIVEAFQGAKVKVPTPDGEVTMKVPPRAQAGQTLRLKAKGVTRPGHEPGDLYVHFRIVMPDGDDVMILKAMELLAMAPQEDPRSTLRLH